MNVIDHGILIPVPPDRVWHILSDISRISEWHTDCRGIAFLTSLRSGPGTRWRLTNKRGHDYVLEITTWYDRLGYEYQYVDGVSLKENRGQLRLQEVPEGTVVQWTFKYRPKGMLGATGMGSKRAINNMMVDSLRGLYRYLTKVSDADKNSDFEAKSSMRDAPDVEARQHYKPRHPSVLQEREPSEAGQPATQPNTPFARPVSAESGAVQVTNGQNAVDFLDPFYEPPVKEGDTKPHPVATDSAPPTPVRSETVTPIPSGFEEPDFLKDQSDTVFSKRPSDTIKLTPPTPLDETPFAEPLDMDGPTRVGITPPSGIPADHPALAGATSDLPWIPPTPSESELHSLPQASSASSTEMLPSLPRIDDDEDLDTSKISVFEVFGLPKPSETQEMRAVKINADVSATSTELKPAASEMEQPSTEQVEIEARARDGATLPLPFLTIAPPPEMEDEADEWMAVHRDDKTTAVAALVDESLIDESTQLLPSAADASSGSSGRAGLRTRQRRSTIKLRRP